MGQTRTFDFKKFNLIVGPHIVGGFAKSSSIKVGRDSEAFEKETGADGEHTRSKSNDLGGYFEVTLQQGSPSNDFFSAQATLDEAAGAGMLPALLRDSSTGKIVATTDACWVKKKPDSTLEAKSSNRVWMLDCGELLYNVTGLNVG